jgi:hypothetical protein
MPSPRSSSDTPRDPEELHVLLHHLILLVPSHDSSRPVIEYNVNNQILQLDAFLAGNINEDGEATQWDDISRTQQRIQHYMDLCNKLMPQLMATIRKKGDENFTFEARNRGLPPKHMDLGQIFLAPNLITKYGKMVEKC